MVEVLQGLAGETVDTIYDLFFSQRKMVAAIVLHPCDLAEMYKPDPLTLFFGGSFRYGEIKMRSRRLIDERRQSFKNKGTDEILAMNKSNVELSYEDIECITIKKGLLSTYLEFKVDKHCKRKIVFSLKRSQVVEVEKVINRVFPSNVLEAS